MFLKPHDEVISKDLSQKISAESYDQVLPILKGTTLVVLECSLKTVYRQKAFVFVVIEIRIKIKNDFLLAYIL